MRRSYTNSSMWKTFGVKSIIKFKNYNKELMCNLTEMCTLYKCHMQVSRER